MNTILDDLIHDAEYLTSRARQLRVSVAEYGRRQGWPDSLVQAHDELYDALSGLSYVLEHLEDTRPE